MKKRALILLALTAIITGAVTCYPTNTARAEEPTTESVLSIEASSNSLKYDVLTPGSSYTKSLTVTNHSPIETTFSLSIAALDELANSASYSRLTEWLIFTGDVDYTLAGEASTTIGLRVKVPKEATAGGQYATLIASNTAGDSIALATISAIIDGNDLKYDGQLTDVNISWFNTSPQVTASAKVQNTGNVDFESTAKLTIKPIFGGEPIHEESKTTTIYPSASATTFDHTWTSAPAIGLYNTSQSITYVNASGEIMEYITERIIIMCPIWLIVVISLIILGTVALIVFLKLRTKKSPQKSTKTSPINNQEEE